MQGQLLHAIPLTSLTGVGHHQANRLAKLNLHSAHDLLFHLPLRYEDRTQVYKISHLKPGLAATIEGVIISSALQPGRKSRLTCTVSDNETSIELLFFNVHPGMKQSLVPGQTILAYGEVRSNGNRMTMLHPEYTVQYSQHQRQLWAALIPVYPTTHGVSQATLRNLTQQVLNLLKSCPIHELLPATWHEKLPSLADALSQLHRPPTHRCAQHIEQGDHPAQRRLVLEELVAHHLSMLTARHSIRRYRAQAIPIQRTLADRFLAALPFKPTLAQQRVIREIEQDLSQHHPMMRLVQGDVGAGKTLVAALVALNVIAHGGQVALMAPTELLAEQHAATFTRWFTPLDIRVGWLMGKQKGKAREAQQQAIADGSIQMIIGTHALFQQQITFKKVTLIIIDEQHRFGVHQRLALWEKGRQHNCYPHQLIMTATPIPRTLAMTAYADLDTSVIDALPPGRTPITTAVVADTRRDEVIDRVRHACSQQRQAYWICTLVEKSDLLVAQAAEETWQALRDALPELNIGLIHGRLKPAEKQAIMHAFIQREIQLLVATTVIEVGVDVPNASLMIIENPERLGLAQLHQLRGRVGRGTARSHCVLLYKTPLSQLAKQRLQVLRDSNDGFFIAQRDLEIRGPGELLGTKQTGNAQFKVVDLLRDEEMLPLAQRVAQHLLQHHPQQAAALIARWMPNTAHYSNI